MTKCRLGCISSGMSMQFNNKTIYNRFKEQGTLSEPKKVSDPDFARLCTANWMRALSILVCDQRIDIAFAKYFYSSVNSRTIPTKEVNTIFEMLIIALHQSSALHALQNIPCKSDVARIAIVGWYYGIYNAASAMIAAQDGSVQQNHAGTARAWDSRILVRNNKLITPPFDTRITTLVKNSADIELQNLLIKPEFRLIHTPTTASEAKGACKEYLSGSVTWARDETEKMVKNSKEFKDLGVSTFHKREAREMRDMHLNKKTVCFLHQAIRYRGKANYRDALFLGYDSRTEGILTDHINDLCVVLDAFVRLAGIFCSRRMGKTIWKVFVDDLQRNRSFTLSPYDIWGKP